MRGELHMIQAVVFDAYGTLFDVKSVTSLLERRFPTYGHAISELWRKKQLEYTWQRSLMKRYADFSVVTRDALRYTLMQLHIPFTDEGVERLANAYLHL